MIQRLLAKAGKSGVPGGVVSVDARGAEADADWTELGSEENYVGYGRTENFASPGGAKADKAHVYAAPGHLRLNPGLFRAIGRWVRNLSY